MFQSFEQEARSLWHAWQTEQTQEQDGPWPFTEGVERLLAAQQLEEVLDALWGIRDTLAAADAAAALAQLTRMA
jgi:hypothetical protein